jgi:hypothetical protein
MDCINIIKQQYFSQDNFNFILHIIKQKKSEESNIQEIVFKVRNDIYNIFIHQISNQKKSINPNNLEELLVTLNKMTIESIIQEIETPLQFKKYKSQSSLQTPLQIPLQIPIQIPVQIPIPIQTSPIQTSLAQTPIQTSLAQTPIQTSLVQIPVQKLKKKIINFFSVDSIFDNGSHKFEIKENVESICIKNMEMYNNLYNITEYNNKIELVENSSKSNIILAPGCYNINQILETIKIQFNEKSPTKLIYDIIYNKNKNRISIKSDKLFNFRFIENNALNSIPLRFLLGYSNNDYMNNNNYTSDKDPVLNIYDNIYIKIKNLENPILSKNFEYHLKINMDYLRLFNNNIKCDDKVLDNKKNINDLLIEFYYRHNTHNVFYKITKQVIFNFILEINY